MSKTRSITDLVTELQRENESMKTLKTLFNTACKKEFGYDIRTIHSRLSKLEKMENRLAERKASQQQGQQTTYEQSE